ncbi:unnamed protein product, partial [Polarella glacialis]
MAAFAGCWQDDEGTVVIVKGDRMYGPDGGQLELQIQGPTSCSFQMGSEIYEGTLTANGQLEWSDGAIWLRVEGEGEDAQPRTALEQAARIAAGLSEGPRPSPSEPGWKLVDSERTRSTDSGTGSRAALTGSVFQDAKARSEDGQDGARSAFEADKAKKTAALERARALARA